MFFFRLVAKHNEWVVWNTLYTATTSTIVFFSITWEYGLEIKMVCMGTILVFPILLTIKTLSVTYIVYQLLQYFKRKSLQILISHVIFPIVLTFKVWFNLYKNCNQIIIMILKVNSSISKILKLKCLTKSTRYAF